MIDDVTPPPARELHDLEEADLIEDCVRLLALMEDRLNLFDDSMPARLDTGAEEFFPIRALDEINSIGATFRLTWTELRIRTPDPPSQIKRRAESIVDRFVRAGTRVVVHGEPGEPLRQRLRKLLGLDAYRT